MTPHEKRLMLVREMTRGVGSCPPSMLIFADSADVPGGWPLYRRLMEHPCLEFLSWPIRSGYREALGIFEANKQGIADLARESARRKKAGVL